MERWKKALATVLALFCTGTTLPLVAHAAPSGETASKQALVVLVNRLTCDDLQQMPHLQELGQVGAMGLLNINTGAGHTDSSAYATLALGVPAKLKQSGVLAYSAQERLPKQEEIPASAMYQQLGGGAVGASGVLLLSTYRQHRQQDLHQWAGTLGTLGDALHSRGLTTAVYGSSDRGGDEWRPGALLTTDSQGRTDAGDVSAAMFVADGERPYGVKTDYARMIAGATNASLTVFDLADLYRLESYRPHLTEARYQQLRELTLQEIDSFIGRLLTGTNPDCLLLVATPEVGMEAAKKSEWLAPIALAGGRTKPHSVLTSATTRRDGIVTNLDVMPTVAEHLGLAIPPGMIGYPLTSATHTRLLPEKLTALKNATVWTYTHRGVILGLVGIGVAVGVIAALCRLIFVTGLSVRFARRMLWAVLGLPLVLYVLPLWRAQNFAETAAALIATMLLLLVIPFRILSICQRVAGRAVWVAGCTIGVILYDIGAGGQLAHSSLLSYDPIVGARYYGIGNEYMGVVVGAAALLYGALLHTRAQEKSRVPFVNFGFLLCGVLLTAFFASPLLGTNTGGALTMAATTAFCLTLQKRRRPLPAFIGVSAALGGALVLVILLNQNAAAPSHIGAATHQVLSGGMTEVVRILSRKSEMFLRFFTTSIWSSVLVVCYGAFLAHLFRKQNREQARANIPAHPAISGAALGAGVGLFTNDSGVVVAGVMLVFTLFPYLLLGLERMQHEIDTALAHKE
ncbi:hypothetical protein [Tumebacillus permanentifrigoris]|uniref:Phosphoglyceromutase n=1 Tax=Tumebacillus permanentifrigoris TaxID=378543 RepID=A0A316D3T2_9BACL|nr:hypothetical protein [Tumebacillus permanentifrigoris]PWK04992.1 hypothetical protein C7459_1306 [Tumebacillus permanentifrigoris]